MSGSWKVRDLTRPRGLELMPVQANNQKYSDLAPHLSEAANSARTLVESQRRSPHHTFILSEAANSARTLVESQRRSQCHTFINYILSQTKWSRDSGTTASRMWKGQFSRGPSFKEIRGDRTVPLLILQH